MSYLLGVDVGTSSVRVGLFKRSGALVDHQTKDITIFNYGSDFYEQSSNEICVEEIASIGFDATCSLVVLDKHRSSISVSTSGNDSINVIMWMDHRSKKEARLINSTEHASLKNVGGLISPEMDPPKILWLKNNMREQYEKAEYFFSLPDYLVWKSTGVDLRSVCSLACKWLYKSSPGEKQWDRTLWESIGLSELCEADFKKIGSRVQVPFEKCADLIIDKNMCLDTGLGSSVHVGVSMIDAHAGGIGGLALTLNYLDTAKTSEEPIKLDEILILVSGTSSCFMASASEERFINGIWGPYYEAMIPGMWLTEAGQSACGKLIDHLISNHPAHNELNQLTNLNNFTSIYETLNTILDQLAKKNNLNHVSKLTKNLHIYPDFHGNRSPLADSTLLGSITGLNFDTGLENLALVYLSCVQSLIYQTKQIIEKMILNGFKFRVITLIGGLANNKLYSQLLSDVCDLPVLVPEKGDSIVLLGASILGAACFAEKLTFDEFLKSFKHSHNSGVQLRTPNLSLNTFHKLKYEVFLRMIHDQIDYREIMSQV